MCFLTVPAGSRDRLAGCCGRYRESVSVNLMCNYDMSNLSPNAVLLGYVSGGVSRYLALLNTAAHAMNPVSKHNVPVTMLIVSGHKELHVCSL